MRIEKPIMRKRPGYMKPTIVTLIVALSVAFGGYSPGRHIQGLVLSALAADCPPVNNTPYFTIVYGNVTLDGNNAPIGTVVKAVSPRGDLVGCYSVTSVGNYGAMYVFGEDLNVSPPTPGMRDGELVTFLVEEGEAQVSTILYWSNDRDLHEINLTATTPPSDIIFADSFESGDLTAWSSNLSDGGDLSASPSAAMLGSYGLQAVIDDNNPLYVTDDTPSAEARYRARFYFDPSSITMSNGDTLYLLYGHAGTSTAVLRIDFRFYNSSYQLRASQITDGATWRNTNWFNIEKSPHFIELDWRAATAPGANDGGLSLWIDGVEQTPLTGTDNDTRRIDRVQLGLASVDSGTRGTFFFDAFESRKQNYIGP